MITRNRFIIFVYVSIRFNLCLSVISSPDCIFQLVSLLKVFCYCLPATQARAFETPRSCRDIKDKNDSDDQWLSSNTSLTHHEVKQPSKEHEVHEREKEQWKHVLGFDACEHV